MTWLPEIEPIKEFAVFVIADYVIDPEWHYGVAKRDHRISVLLISASYNFCE